MNYRLVPSPLGTAIVFWRENHNKVRVERIFLPRRDVAAVLGRWPQVGEGSNRTVDAFCERIARYLHGEVVSLSADLLALDRHTPFSRQVMLAVHAIPRGQVRTYGQIAATVGRPRAARAVGNVMARNPFPIVIPCHRVIRADGTAGEFGGRPALKLRLLSMEGVRLPVRGFEEET